MDTIVLRTEEKYKDFYDELRANRVDNTKPDDRAVALASLYREYMETDGKINTFSRNGAFSEKRLERWYRLFCNVQEHEELANNHPGVRLLRNFHELGPEGLAEVAEVSYGGESCARAHISIVLSVHRRTNPIYVKSGRLPGQGRSRGALVAQPWRTLLKG